MALRGRHGTSRSSWVSKPAHRRERRGAGRCEQRTPAGGGRQGRVRTGRPRVGRAAACTEGVAARWASARRAAAGPPALLGSLSMDRRRLAGRGPGGRLRLRLRVRRPLRQERLRGRDRLARPALLAIPDRRGCSSGRGRSSCARTATALRGPAPAARRRPARPRGVLRGERVRPTTPRCSTSRRRWPRSSSTSTRRSSPSSRSAGATGCRAAAVAGPRARDFGRRPHDRRHRDRGGADRAGPHRRLADHLLRLHHPRRPPGRGAARRDGGVADGRRRGGDAAGRGRRRS